MNKCGRTELVVAIHGLASNFENAIGRFQGEDKRKAEGDIAHAMKVAGRHNYNGAGCIGGNVITDLQGAAYDYAKAVLDERAADEAGMPSEMLRQLRANIRNHQAQLCGEAMAYFDRVYDGAPT